MADAAQGWGKVPMMFVVGLMSGGAAGLAVLFLVQFAQTPPASASPSDAASQRHLRGDLGRDLTQDCRGACDEVRL